MKKAIQIIIILLVSFFRVGAQESAFEELLDYPMDFTQSLCRETSDGHYLVVPGACMVLKLSKNGEVLKEMTYDLGETKKEHVYTWISGLVDIPSDNEHHLVIAESYDGDTETSNVLHIVKIDNDLNYNTEEVLVVDLSNEIKDFWIVSTPHYLVENDGSICFASHAVKWDNSDCMMFVRINSKGEKTVVFENRFNGDDHFEICDFAQRDDHYGMVVGGYRYDPASQFRRALSYFEVSHDFVVDSIFCFATGIIGTAPLIYNNLSDSLIQACYIDRSSNVLTEISDNIFLFPTQVLGMHNVGFQQQHGVAIWKMDSLFNLIDHIFFDVFNGNNQNEYLYAINPLVVQGNNVYFCYTIDEGTPYIGPIQNVICKLDTDLNLKWKRWYGDVNEYHVITDCEPTNDEGCVLTGYGHPNPNHYLNPYLYVLKITPEGYCSIPEETTLLKPFCCIPNPVETYLRIEYSPDVTPSLLELFDLQGRLILTQKNDMESVSLDNLPSGSYTLRVVMEDGMVYSDQVVKQ